MPHKASTPCRVRSCPNVVSDGTGYCPQHKPEPWHKNNNYYRNRSRKMRREREIALRNDPLCAECMKHGIYREATQRDHIIPLAQGGLDIASNKQNLCDECHKVKTQRESREGQHG